MDTDNNQQPAPAGLDLREAIIQAERMETAPDARRCDCCGRERPADDAFPQRDGGVICGNCDGGEQPGCPNCAPPTFLGILADPTAQR